jgi:hypothetical protein
MCVPTCKDPCVASQSPINHVDPLERALLTTMYGMVVHFGTMWIVLSSSEQLEVQGQCDSCSSPNTMFPTHWLASLLLCHEYWVYLQHLNVLANPLCQRLDRQYGIALLRGNQHWAIAGTLSAYWCRESISMFLCLPFLRTTSTKYLVLYSLVYHTIKSQGVRKDAMRRYSPEFGIMRVVIDKFYLHSRKEAVVTMVRLMLQGLDTFIHGMILRDLWNSSAMLQVSNSPSWSSTRMIQVVFTVWVAHAAMNQFFRCSTATIMVQMWRWLTVNKRQTIQTSKEICGITMDSDDDTMTDSGSSDSVASLTSGYNEPNNQDFTSFVVRDLLREGRVPSELKGRHGAASGGVDTAVRVETMLAILSVVYVLGFDDVPFKVLILNFTSVDEAVFFRDPWTLLLYAYLLWSILYAASAKLLPKQERGMNAPVQRKSARRLMYAINTGFLAIILLGVSTSRNPMNDRIKLMALLLASWVVTKSFLFSASWRGSKLFWNVTDLMELVVRAALATFIADRHKESIAVIDASMCVMWLCQNVILPGGTLDIKLITTDAPDIAFLGHPSELSDIWALLLLPYSLQERWKRPWWSVPLWPIHYAVGYYFCNWHVKILATLLPSSTATM